MESWGKSGLLVVLGKQQMLSSPQALHCCVILNEMERKNGYYLYYGVWQLFLLN